MVTEMAQAREAVGVFDNPVEMDAAIAELENTAFPHDSISILANSPDLRKEFGISVVRPEDVEDNPDTPRTVPIHPEEKTMGLAALMGVTVYTAMTAGVVFFGQAATPFDWIASIVLGAVSGAVIGLAVYLYSRHTKRLREQQIEAGGIVMWVRTPNEEREQMARGILMKHGARDVHIHQVAH
ncbi:MAG TPA: hypothetical protein VL625_04280 [Patescibacteria group bacterium]|nr:hypothetical protein [Patescibacteria group bacterium]